MNVPSSKKSFKLKLADKLSNLSFKFFFSLISSGIIRLHYHYYYFIISTSKLNRNSTSVALTDGVEVNCNDRSSEHIKFFENIGLLKRQETMNGFIS